MKMNELEIQAKLNGKEVKGAPARLNVSREKREEYDNDAQNLLKRMKRNHEMRKQGKNG